MKVANNLTPAELRAKAQAWYERQCAISQQALGDSWPKHREWVEAYLKEEIRQRLLELGWRPKE